MLCCSVLSCSSCQLFVTPYPVACQPSQSMGILQARVLEGLPCPPPGDLPNRGVEPRSPTFQADSLPSKPSGTMNKRCVFLQSCSDLSPIPLELKKLEGCRGYPGISWVYTFSSVISGSGWRFSSPLPLPVCWCLNSPSPRIRLFFSEYNWV